MWSPPRERPECAGRTATERRAHRVFWGLTVGAFAVLTGCSDAAEFGVSRRPGDGEQSLVPSPSETSPSGSSSSVPAPSSSSATSGTGVDEVGDPFEEENCPEVPQRLEVSECDPLGEPLECQTGQGCYPYVQYPTSKCQPETFGTRCDYAGDGEQGEPCAGERCAHGFLCVVTGRGTECARLCRMPGPNTCPDGLICGSLDIAGFGVCI